MALSDVAIRKSQPQEKQYKMTDGEGLYLLITPAGGKYWRLDYRFDGKRKTYAIGTYPDVPLKLARERKSDARKLLAEGIDPNEFKKSARLARMEASASSFEYVAREWLLKFSTKWTDEHTDRLRRRFENDVFPYIGSKPISQIDAPELLRVIRRIESRGAIDTAHRALQNCGMVFRYAIATAGHRMILQGR